MVRVSGSWKAAVLKALQGGTSDARAHVHSLENEQAWRGWSVWSVVRRDPDPSNLEHLCPVCITSGGREQCQLTAHDQLKQLRSKGA